MKNSQDDASGSNSKIAASQLRGGVYTFDLLFAVLIVLIMFYFATVATVEFQNSIFSTYNEFRGSNKVFLISEKIITRDITIFDSKNSYQNYIDPAKWVGINSTEYIQDFKISGINISSSFSNSISEGSFNKSNTYCFTRIVLVKGLLIDSPGVVRICLQDN
jgi:hypothetical protein